MLCNHFRKDPCALINHEEWKGEKQYFIMGMRNYSRDKNMCESWKDNRVHEGWSQLSLWILKIWRVVFVLPLTLLASKRGFSKMKKRSKLSLLIF